LSGGAQAQEGRRGGEEERPRARGREHQRAHRAADVCFIDASIGLSRYRSRIFSRIYPSTGARHARDGGACLTQPFQALTHSEWSCLQAASRHAARAPHLSAAQHLRSARAPCSRSQRMPWTLPAAAAAISGVTWRSDTRRLREREGDRRGTGSHAREQASRQRAGSDRAAVATPGSDSVRGVGTLGVDDGSLP